LEERGSKLLANSREMRVEKKIEREGGVNEGGDERALAMDGTNSLRDGGSRDETAKLAFWRQK